MMSGIIRQKNSLRRVRDSQISLTHTLEPPGIRMWKKKTCNFRAFGALLYLFNPPPLNVKKVLDILGEAGLFVSNDEL